jgi:hypothetical protein
VFVTDNTTFVTGPGLALALALCVLIMLLPRRYAVLPFVAMVCWMTMGQRLLVFDLNFTMARVLLACALLRVMLRGELKVRPLGSLGTTLVLWVLVSIVTYTLLLGTSAALVNRLGLAFDALGMYFVFRSLIRDIKDLRTAVRCMAWVIVPLASSILIERQTLNNPFAALGGVPPETLVREGVPRCQGPFAHPILAGAFGSAVLPLFIGLWSKATRDRALALAGIVSACTIVFAAASSGPLLASAIGVLGSAMFAVRQHMRTVRWSLVGMLVVAQVAMAAPVWFLLARVGVFGGSTGYHRAILIDHAINNFSSWWLVGTESTAQWGYYMFDITNQYVLIGVNGGIVSLALFVALIAVGFSQVGRAVAARPGDGQSDERRLSWSLGASLVVHATNYISVPYFDQNIVNWYLLLAMISSAAALGAAHEQQTQDSVQNHPPSEPALTGPSGRS